ncbi:MAG: RIP metalloprotease RseP, partial [Patescibacteria group bacterium]
HFFTAKFFKIKVEEFGFGFPPRVWGRKIGETLYSLNLLPIGGFVKLYGEDEAGGGKIGKGEKVTKNLDRAFFARPIWQRLIVVVSGVFMNFVLAVAIISFIFATVGAPTPGNDVVVTQIAKDSPAEGAGLKTGDIIKKINGEEITQSSQLINITRQNLGKPIRLQIRNPKSEIRNLEITPREKYPSDQGPMGVSIGQKVEIKKYSWYQAPIAGTKEAIKTSVLIVAGVGTVISEIVRTGGVPQGVAGPIGIAQLTGEFVHSGIYAVLSFLALLSLNLAILNVLPIPALDGGRLFFILIEAVTRRKVPAKFESYAHAVGIALLLALIALITLNDVGRLVSGQPILPKIE